MIAPWVESIRAARSRANDGPLILSLATVDSDGGPQVRSVVCRRLEDDGTISITSDARSAKNAQLVRDPRAAAVAWFPVTREQFRFEGPAEVLGATSNDPGRTRIWRDLSPQTRATFFWPASGEPKHADPGAFIRASEAPEPPASFEVLLLRPRTVEHLLLTTHPHQRTRWTLDVDWSQELLNP